MANVHLNLIVGKSFYGQIKYNKALQTILIIFYVWDIRLD